MCELACSQRYPHYQRGLTILLGIRLFAGHDANIVNLETVGGSSIDLPGLGVMLSEGCAKLCG